MRWLFLVSLMLPGLLAAATGFFCLRLAWWWWRHGRRLRREASPESRRSAMRWFPWLTTFAWMLIAWPWLQWAGSQVLGPPDLPSGRGWRCESLAAGTDHLRGESRYIRWRVREPVETVRPAVEDWVRTRGRWWLRRGIPLESETDPRTDAVAPCMPHSRTLRLGGQRSLFGRASPPPEPGDAGTAFCCRGDEHDLRHEIAARITPIDERTTRVEIWLGVLQDL